MDFPSDANPHKEIARGMIRMVYQVNSEILPAVDHQSDHAHGDEHHPEGAASDGHHQLRVTCWTCHRGETTPSTAPPPRERD